VTPAPESLPADATLADAGEFGAIAAFTAVFRQSEAVVVGPGDDAASVRVPGDVLVATDVLVEGRHFRRDWAEAHDVGRRAAAQSLSDLNAMGGTTTAVTVGLAAPADLPLQWARGLAEGIAAECDLVGASVVGGDLTRCDLVVISLTAIGHADGDPVLRSGARPGDVVALRGRQGWAAAGLAVLSRGFRSPRAVVEAYRRPEVPYAAGPQALAAGATAMVDVSDGLLADLGHVALASGVAIDLVSAALPVAEPLQAVGAALGADPLGFVLGGGDDHPVVATFPAGTDLPEGWTVIGAVVEGSESGEGGAAAGQVTVDGAAYDGERGWRHF
jgi:thiamine-monophosphate kinase